MRGRARRRPPGAGDVEFWRALRVGTRLAVGPAHEARGPARRRELEVTGARSVSVPDGRGGLRAEVLFFDLRSPGEQGQSLVVSFSGARLVLRLCAAIEGGARREDLGQRGLGWLCEDGPQGLAYAAFPVAQVSEARGERRVAFAGAPGGPLHGEYATPGSDRIRRVLIIEYAALEACDNPVLMVVEEQETGEVTVLGGNLVGPAQFER
jgi:hypothetical protein